MEKGLIFTYLVVYGGSFWALFNPFVGLCVYIFCGIVTPEALWWWSLGGGGGAGFSKIAAIAMLIGWAGHNFGNLKFRQASPVMYSLVGFYVWAHISGYFAEFPQASDIFCSWFFKIILPLFVGLTIINSVKQLKILAWVMVLSHGFLAYETNMNYLDGFIVGVTNDLDYAGLDNNSFAIAMVTGCGLAFFMGLRQTVWWRKWFCFFLAGLLAHVPMFMESRGGMLGLILTGAATFWILPRERKPYLAFFLALVVGLRLAGPAVVARFMSSFAGDDLDRSATSRLVMWEQCIDVMFTYPIMGAGPDNWPYIAPRYGWRRGKEAHTLWLQTGAEMGFVGLGLLAGGWYGLCCWRLYKLTRRKDLPDEWLADAGRMVIASLAGFATAAQFVSLEGLENPYYVCLLGAGVLKIASMPAHEYAMYNAPRDGQAALPAVRTGVRELAPWGYRPQYA